MKRLMQLLTLILGIGATVQVLYAYSLDSDDSIEVQEDQIIRLIEEKRNSPEDKELQKDLKARLHEYLKVIKSSSSVERGDPGV